MTPPHLNLVPDPDDDNPRAADEEALDPRLLAVYRLLLEIGRRARARADAAQQGEQRQSGEDGDRT
jgi:hypothetical protein